MRKLISKFRKISQENRAASQSTSNATTPPTTSFNPSSFPQPIIPEPIANPTPSPPQHLQLPPISTNKTRDKLETISERIETQESKISQITSVHQSPPLQRPPKSSKWKWLKTGSTGPETDSPPRGSTSNTKSSPPQEKFTNPFDSNLTDDDLQGNATDGYERRLSIPLSLFIPRSAQRESAKTSEEGNDDHVRHSQIYLYFFN